MALVGFEVFRLGSRPKLSGLCNLRVIVGRP